MEHEAIEETGEIVNLRIARETLTGDLREAAIGWIRALPKPWEQLTEEQQRDVFESIGKQAKLAAARAIELVAASGRRTISATVDSVTVKDGVKVVLKAALAEESVLFLVLSQGSKVQVVEADLAPFDGERPDGEKPKPDQAALDLAVEKAEAEADEPEGDDGEA